MHLGVVLGTNHIDIVDCVQQMKFVRSWLLLGSKQTCLAT